MHIYNGFFHEHILVVPIISLGIATILKGIFHMVAERFSVAKMLGSGGMPSAHSTFVISLLTAIGIKDGIYSDLFAVCLVLSIIVIYDAMNIRYQSGLHAKAINKINSHESHSLNESLGHTPLEAFAGGIVGLASAAIIMFI